MKPETFIILTPGFPKDEADSTCLPAQQLFVRILKEKFPSLEILVLSFQYPFVATEYDWNHCRVITLGGKGKSKLFRLLLWQRAWNRLRQLTKEKQVKGLLSFWCSECALIGSWFARKYHLQHQCWILGQDAKKGNHYVKWIRPRSESLVAMSDFLLDSFHFNHSIKPAMVIPNGIDPRLFENATTSKDIDILGAGYLIPLKQFDVFIDIISAIKKFIPGIRTVICGKGPEENKLRTQIDRAGLSDNISLVGEIPHHEVLKYMQRSRIFLHSSSYEGFGTVCIEALYAGAHVVSFIHPMNEIIPQWHIVKTREEMIQITIELLQNHALENNSVCPYLMKDSVARMMHLFGL